ncbi:hypothetical protein BE08_45700 [Sorangium cellulosum]|uniref:Spore coat protein n=1 Tax=Sorangium cellulosum TaxID=56 RepID=A0A150PPU0_SORCE|nr:hypothetical protein BE08_45700 [Sorangium cellulosum]
MMRPTTCISFALALSTAGAGCGGAEDDGPGATMPCYPPDPAAADGDPDALYAASDVPRFDFRLHDETWEHLQGKEGALAEEYVEAEACYRGRSLGLVGLRMKGGYGTLEMCFEEPLRLPCPKLSMKVKLDEYVDGKRFFRQKRLNLHSMIRDPTKLHERLAYGLYREMGVAAPRSAWATVHVNGEPLGLFAMVEDVDGRFTDNQFPEDPDGNLYEAAWPASDDPAYYADKIETNEEEATHERFVAFAEDLRSTEGAERLAALARWMDVEELQRYMAVDDAILNWDGITTFYVDEEGSAANHNYFVYEAPSSGKFHVVPWDMDNTLSVWSARFFGAVPHWTEMPEDCDAKIPVQEGHAHVRAPGCDALFGALREDIEGYRSAVRDLLEGPFREGRLEEQVDRHAALIRPFVAEDTLGPTLPTWNADVASLRGELQEMRRRMERLLDEAARGD